MRSRGTIAPSTTKGRDRIEPTPRMAATGQSIDSGSRALSESDRSGGEDVMPGHQEFKALSADEVKRAATWIADMQKWAREAYLSTKHVEDIWVRYFEAEHHLHWILPPATEPEEP